MCFQEWFEEHRTAAAFGGFILIAVLVGGFAVCGAGIITNNWMNAANDSYEKEMDIAQINEKSKNDYAQVIKLQEMKDEQDGEIRKFDLDVKKVSKFNESVS